MAPEEARSGRACVVAIDGPAGAGKSTVARRVAQALEFTLLDTGALYRTVALAAERAGATWSDTAAVTAVAEELVRAGAMRIEALPDSGMRVLLHGVDVSDSIRSPSVSMGASTVSAIPGVRTALLDVQRAFARAFGLAGAARGVVCEGRDIGTVIFPDAEVKIFLTASVDERSRRRHSDFLIKDPSFTLEQTRFEVSKRDAQDESRPVAPLRRADDALVIDSTGAALEDTIARVLELVRAKLGERPGPAGSGG